jgi:hypothetical protein
VARYFAGKLACLSALIWRDFFNGAQMGCIFVEFF